MKKIGFVLALIVVLASLGVAQNNHNNGNGNGRTAVIKVNSSENSWTESQIAQRLMAELSRNGNGEIVRFESLEGKLPAFPLDIYNTESLSSWGTESGRRYLIVVAIESEGLRKKKTFSIPLVLSKYENVGEVVGELRIVDISRRRLVLSERFVFEKEARRIVQAMPDDDINDADLHLSAPEKIRFFSDFENELAIELAGKIRSATNLK